MTRRRVLSLMVLVNGLGVSAPPARAADVPRSLAAALQDELGRGGSVAILGSYDGLIALSSDGKLRRTLVPGRIFGVRVDNRSEAIWYRADRTGRTSDLMVIDLREAKIRPVLLIRGLGLTEEPDIAYDDPEEVSPPGRNRNVLLLGRSGPVLQRNVDSCAGKPRRGCPKFRRIPCEPTPGGERCLQLEPDALPLLNDLAKRAVGRSLFLPVEKSPAPPPVPMGEFACRRCGQATAIPGTPFLAVMTQAQGDFCHVVAEVYDPKTREFTDINNGRRSPRPFAELGVDFGDAWVAGAGDAFIQAGVLYAFTTGRVPWRAPPAEADSLAVATGYLPSTTDVTDGAGDERRRQPGGARECARDHRAHAIS